MTILAHGSVRPAFLTPRELRSIFRRAQRVNVLHIIERTAQLRRQITIALSRLGRRSYEEMIFVCKPGLGGILVNITVLAPILRLCGCETVGHILRRIILPIDGLLDRQMDGSGFLHTCRCSRLSCPSGLFLLRQRVEVVELRSQLHNMVDRCQM